MVPDNMYRKKLIALLVYQDFSVIASNKFIPDWNLIANWLKSVVMFNRKDMYEGVVSDRKLNVTKSKMIKI